MKTKIGVWLPAISFAACALLACPSVRAAAPPPQAGEFETGEEARLRGAFDAALPHFQAALLAAQKSGDGPGAVKSLLKIGLLEWNIGRVDAAVERFKAAEASASRLKLTSDLALARDTLALIAAYKEGKSFRDVTGERDKSIAAFQSAIEISNRIDGREYAVKCLRQMSLNYQSADGLPEYFRLNQQALALARQVQNERDVGVCLNNIGIYYFELEDYSPALGDFERALEIARKYKNPANTGDALSNLSLVYAGLGNFDRSIEYLTQVLEIDRPAGDPRTVAKDLNNIGIAYRRKALVSESREEYATASRYFQEALGLAAKANDTDVLLSVLNNLGSVLVQLGRNTEAIGYFNSSLALAEKAQDLGKKSVILNNLGIANFNLGNLEASTGFYQRAIDLLSGTMGKKVLWETYLELANAQKKQGRTAEARENFRMSIAIIEEIRSSIEAEELKATYFGSDKRLDAYTNLIDLLLRPGAGGASPSPAPQPENVAKAFSYAEGAKARAFLDSLEVSNVSLSAAVDVRLANEEKTLVHEISGLYGNLLLPAQSSEQIANARSQIADLETRLESLKREIRTASPAYANLKYPKIASALDAQRDLPDKRTVFLAFVLGKESSWAFAVSKKEVRAFPLPPRGELREMVRAYLRSVTDKTSGDAGPGLDLYKKLVEPALAPGIKNIIVVPDDVLYYVPFEALPESAEAKDPLLRKYSVSYAPSVSSWQSIRSRRRNAPYKKDLLAVGDPEISAEFLQRINSPALRDVYSASGFDLSPLKYSALEVNGIASLFRPSRTTVLLGPRASESAFKALPLADFRVIHLAAHGLVDDKSPSRSAIILAPDEKSGEDGFLQTRDIYGLRVAADLVVLSACQTGLGRLLRGEGIEGLNRAFFYAGASSVLMTLWPINDQASAQLMERFYRCLKSSDSAAAALRAAKLEMLDSPDFAHPYYWAGYVLAGDGSRVIFGPGFPLWVIAAVLAAVLVAWGYARFMRNSASSATPGSSSSAR